MKSGHYLVDSNIVIYHASNKKLLTTEVLDIFEYCNHIYIPSKCVEELIYLQQSGRIDVKHWKSAVDIIRIYYR